MTTDAAAAAAAAAACESDGSTDCQSIDDATMTARGLHVTSPPRCD